MALVPCPECQKEVSTEARACPQCAFPFPGKKGAQEGHSAANSHTCPECHGLLPPHARACPYCGILLIGGLGPQRGSGEFVQETLLCPHCGASYTRTVEKSAGVTGILPSGQRQVGDTTEIRHGPADASLNTPAVEGPRRRSPLWQDPSILQKTASSRPRRSKKHSLIIGLLLLVIVAISVFFGAIWQLQAWTSVTDLLSWKI